MSLPPLDLTLPTDHLRITVWPDPVVDLVGHDLRSAYVERFWLPVLGPSTTFLLRRLAAGLEEHPDGFDLPLLDTAHALGLGVKGGRNAPFLRAIARTVKFRLSWSPSPGALAVHARVAALNRSQLERLPPALQDEHAAWQRQAERTPDLEQQRRRARRLALSLAELGESDESIEQQLHRWRLHPALAHEALRWARKRQAGVVAIKPATAADNPAERAVSAADEGGADQPWRRPWPPKPPPRIGSPRPSTGHAHPPTGDAA